MKTEEIISFFDKWAPEWDSDLIKDGEVIDIILNKSGVVEGTTVLDVACGTGVLFEDYLKRKAAVTGIDISPEMVKIAKEKYPDIKVICGDAENYSFEEKFGVIMIYNAFPHFPEPESMIKNLCLYLKEGGRLTVAHGMSKAQIDACHAGAAKNISLPLPEAENLARMLGKFLKVDTVISDERMYMVSGVNSLVLDFNK